MKYARLSADDEPNENAVALQLAGVVRSWFGRYPEKEKTVLKILFAKLTGKAFDTYLTEEFCRRLDRIATTGDAHSDAAATPTHTIEPTRSRPVAGARTTRRGTSR